MAWIYRRSRKSVGGGVGPVTGVSAAWMPRPSPQGRVYGVPCPAHPPGQIHDPHSATNPRGAAPLAGNYASARNTSARIAGTAWIMKMRRLTL